jgi:hypothetical protein
VARLSPIFHPEGTILKHVAVSTIFAVSTLLGLAVALSTYALGDFSGATWLMGICALGLFLLPPIIRHWTKTSHQAEQKQLEQKRLELPEKQRSAWADTVKSYYMANLCTHEHPGCTGPQVNAIMTPYGRPIKLLISPGKHCPYDPQDIERHLELAFGCPVSVPPPLVSVVRSRKESSPEEHKQNILNAIQMIQPNFQHCGILTGPNGDGVIFLPPDQLYVSNEVKWALENLTGKRIVFIRQKPQTAGNEKQSLTDITPLPKASPEIVEVVGELAVSGDDLQVAEKEMHEALLAQPENPTLVQRLKAHAEKSEVKPSEKMLEASKLLGAQTVPQTLTRASEQSKPKPEAVKPKPELGKPKQRKKTKRKPTVVSFGNIIIKSANPEVLKQLNLEQLLVDDESNPEDDIIEREPAEEEAAKQTNP